MSDFQGPMPDGVNRKNPPPALEGAFERLDGFSNALTSLSEGIVNEKQSKKISESTKGIKDTLEKFNKLQESYQHQLKTLIDSGASKGEVKEFVKVQKSFLSDQKDLSDKAVKKQIESINQLFEGVQYEDAVQATEIQRILDSIKIKDEEALDERKEERGKMDNVFSKMLDKLDLGKPGEEIVNALLGPMRLITEPLGEFLGVGSPMEAFNKISGFFTGKKERVRPKRDQMLREGIEGSAAVYLADTLIEGLGGETEAESPQGMIGNFLDRFGAGMFGAGGLIPILKGVSAALLPLAAPLAAIAGTAILGKFIFEGDSEEGRAAERRDRTDPTGSRGDEERDLIDRIRPPKENIPRFLWPLFGYDEEDVTDEIGSKTPPSVEWTANEEAIYGRLENSQQQIIKYLYDSMGAAGAEDFILSFGQGKGFRGNDLTMHGSVVEFTRSPEFENLQSVVRVNDAIIRPNGDIIHTHPDDTLIATKNEVYHSESSTDRESVTKGVEFTRSPEFENLQSVVRVNGAIIRPNGDIVHTHPDDTLIATKNEVYHSESSTDRESVTKGVELNNYFTDSALTEQIENRSILDPQFEILMDRQIQEGNSVIENTTTNTEYHTGGFDDEVVGLLQRLIDVMEAKDFSNIIQHNSSSGKFNFDELRMVDSNAR